MISSQLQALIEQVPKDFADAAATYMDVRRTFAPFHGYPVQEDTEIRIGELRGVRVGYCAAPSARSAQRTAFYCHGGAFVSCPLDVYHFYAEIISKLTVSTVVTPDFRLAPEHPYPAALDDCYNAYCGLLDSGVDPASIYFIGDSCGGGLALSTLLRARDNHVPLPFCFVSLTGWFDLSVADTTGDEQIDPFLTPAWVRNRAQDYLQGKVDLKAPEVSPAYADLTGLPPLYLQIGQHDTLREGALKVAANAVRAGVDITMESWPHLIHGWHGLVTAGVPEAQDAWERIREYIERIARK